MVAGRGNNGGDALVAARVLYDKGIDVTVYIAKDNERGSSLFKDQYKAAIYTGVPIIIIPDIDATQKINLDCYDLIVDGLLGTGFKEDLDSLYKSIIELINKSKTPVISIDLPSGLDASSNKVRKCVHADTTVALSNYKICHVLYPSSSFCGKILLKDIGIPHKAIENTITNVIKIPCKKTFPELNRKKYGHKGHYGHVLIIGGSLGKAGAPVMAALAAFNSGAGLVTCMLPSGCESFIAPYPHIMSVFTETTGYFTEKDVEAALQMTEGKDAVLIGPGMGRNNYTGEFLKNFLSAYKRDLIIDADGLYNLKVTGMTDFNKSSGSYSTHNVFYDNKVKKFDIHTEEQGRRVILTPHLGELSILTDKDVKTLEDKRLQIAELFCSDNNLFLMTKSAETVITTPDKKHFISSCASGALSKAGNGDVLAGIALALLGQKFTALEACIKACQIQGAACKHTQNNKRSYSVSPIDVIKNIGLK